MMNLGVTDGQENVIFPYPDEVIIMRGLLTATSNNLNDIFMILQVKRNGLIT